MFDLISAKRFLRMPKRILLWAAMFLMLAAFTGCGGGSSTPPVVVGESGTVYLTLPTVDAVAALRIDSSNHFNAIIGSPFLAGISPTSVLVHPNNKFIYVVNRGSDNISLLMPDSRTGVLTEVMPRTPTQVDPEVIIMNSAGSLIFALNQGSNTISVFSVNSSSGALSEISGSPFPTAPHPANLALSRGETLLYVANVNLASVSAYTVAAGGGLTQVVGSPFPVAGSGPVALATGASDHFLYVANSSSSDISIMAIDGTGALSELLASPVPTSTAGISNGPQSVELDSTGSFMYVANAQTNNVSAFAVDSNTGKLTTLTGSPFAAGTRPIATVVNSNTTTLFVLNQGGNTISQFGINTNGTLNVSTTTAQPTGNSPTSIAFTH
jgi:6-phosphogluconolactonase